MYSSLAAAVALSAVISGCGPEHGDSAGPASASAPASAPIPVIAPVVKVVNPGAEPRSVLTRVVPTSQNVILASRYVLTQQIDDGQSEDVSNPPVTIPMTLDSASVQEDGSATVTWNLHDLTSADAGLSSALAKASGSRAVISSGPDGAVSALALTPSAAAPDAARAAIELALSDAMTHTIVFPKDPVGVGATWTIDQPIETSLSLTQTTTVTLLSRSGNSMDVSLTVTQTPKSPSMTLPSGEGTLQIADYRISGTGSATLDLAQAMPVKAEVTMSGGRSFTNPDTGAVLLQYSNSTTTWSN